MATGLRIDMYRFQPAIEKLRFVHDVIAAAAQARPAAASGDSATRPDFAARASPA
mgnify:CR=1 FL=1